MQLALPLGHDEHTPGPAAGEPPGGNQAEEPGGRNSTPPVDRPLSPARPTTSEHDADDRNHAQPPSPVPPMLAAAWPPQVRVVRHQRARRYILRIEQDGAVRVTVPRRGSIREARRFVERQRAWIERQRAKLVDRLRAAPEPLSREAIRAARRRAAPLLRERLLELAAIHGLEVTSVTIRNQRTRWGSCGRDGSISLNWRLADMPDEVRDYVLVHELMHLRVRDHSPRFWAAVRAAMPDYQRARRWLRTHGRTLS